MAGRRLRIALAAALGTMVIAGSAQAVVLDEGGTDSYSAIPTQSEVDQAIADLANGAKQVVELKAPRPAWFTPELEEQVRANGMALAPDVAPLPGQVGIRPGSMMVMPFICTMNFIFEKSGTVAIGTAGHCLESNEPVVLLTLAPGGENPVLVELGRVLLKQDAGIGRDYGLVEVPPHLHDWVYATVAGIGGPCGVYPGGDAQPVAYYGQGLVGGFPGTPRAGMGFELSDEQSRPLRELVRGTDWDWDEDSIVWAGYIYGGDSGSPVRIGQLPAVSNLTHGIGVTGLEPSVVAWGTRVTTITNSGWTLVNSGLCPPSEAGLPTLPGLSGDGDEGSTGSGKGNGRGGKGKP